MVLCLYFIIRVGVTPINNLVTIYRHEQSPGNSGYLRQHPGSLHEESDVPVPQASHSRNFPHYSCLDILIIRERVSTTKQTRDGSPWSCYLVLPGQTTPRGNSKRTNSTEVMKPTAGSPSWKTWSLKKSWKTVAGRGDERSEAGRDVKRPEAGRSADRPGDGWGVKRCGAGRGRVERPAVPDWCNGLTLELEGMPKDLQLKR